MTSFKEILAGNSGIVHEATFLLLLGIFLVLSAGCDSVSQTVGPGNDSGDIPANTWLIPQTEVIDGGPGKDGIPSVDRPLFTAAFGTDYVQDDRLVVGIRIGDVVRAYPHQVLDWHEIVNDQSSGEAFAITYCPLTGTGIAWDREIGGQVTEFGVSGLLFRNNLVPYDRRTNSNWSQMQLRSVKGQRAGTFAQTIQIVETTWKTWREMYPSSQVLTLDTGFQRSYSSFAYGRNYLSDNEQLLFPVHNHDARLPNKERVHGIVPDTTDNPSVNPRVYVVSRFGAGVNLIEDSIENQGYVIVGSSDINFVAAFESRLADGTKPVFETVQRVLPVILQDEQGNRWDIFGVAVSGPRKGQRLTAARSFTGYWFGWADFYPGVEIYEQ